MKWFKHYSDANSNLKIQAVIDEFGMEGYGFWWITVELVAQQGSGNEIQNDKNWMRGLVRRSGVSPDKAEKILEFFAKERLIDAEALAHENLKISQLSEYGDEYSGRKKDVPIVSRHSPDNVVLEEIRIDKKRIEEKPTARLDYLTSIPAQDLKELSDKYDASPRQVERKAETMKNYCLSKGKTYKNYRAFLENGLDKDFGRRVKQAPKVEEAPLDADAQARVEAIKAEIAAKMKSKRVGV